MMNSLFFYFHSVICKHCLEARAARIDPQSRAIVSLIVNKNLTNKIVADCNRFFNVWGNVKSLFISI